MEENGIISTEFIWLASENDLPPIDSKEKINFSFEGPLKSLKSYLSKLFDLPVDIHDWKSKISASISEASQKDFQTKPSMFYAKYLFSVMCKIHLKQLSHSDISVIDFIRKLIKRFCSNRAVANFPELYWNVDIASVIMENCLLTVDNFIDLKCFSLGNIVKLNAFVEHFNSDYSLDPYKHKITQVKVKFLHDEEVLHLHFVVAEAKVRVKKRNALTHRMFQLIIPYSTIHTILISDAKNFSVYIRLSKSPMMFAVKHHEDLENYISYMELTPNTKWLRAVDLFEGCPSNIRKEFSLNSVLCLNFPKENHEVLKIMPRQKNVQTYFSFMNVVRYESVNPSIQISDFECYYAFQCLLTHSHEILDHLMDKEKMEAFRNFLVQNSKEKTKESKALSGALYNIYSAISKCHVVILNYSLKQLFQKLLNPALAPGSDGSSDKLVSKSKVLIVKRAIIMPTHVKFLPPNPILKSRALRSCNPEYSLRLTIRDVNFETINFSYRGFDEYRRIFLKSFFERHYKSPMLRGIKIGKRDYRYVGGSTSQLRGHGLWFYAKDETGKTADKLREDFGNMDKIKQVPKYMARMGQTFSQACGHIIVPQKCTNVDSPDQDITHGIKIYLSEDDLDNPSQKKFLKTVEECQGGVLSNEPYVFSDGIGRISLEFAEEVYKALDLDKARPSAFQIRYAGCKGMLVVDPTLEGKQIKFRESMKKFSSKDESLEIIKYSEKRTASLNRPLITILEQLGVLKEVFIKLQKEMIQNHIKSMFQESAACEFLNRNSKLRFDYIGMHNVGISFTEDPLFRSMIYALFRKNLDLLKNKANVEVPYDKGRSMLGVLDETLTLEYGQVFVQYTNWNNDETCIIEGTIVVTKNPCMHAGDVRKFTAMKSELLVAALGHICDCIVFPAKGPRPHPDEMAGSDLDGDEYHVFWYEGLIFERENESPMHFALPKDHSRDKESIEVSDELDHLCSYIINDNVGLIASAHLAFADKERNGIFGENCVRLAKKYAIALDFAKSGKIATRHRNDRVFNYPDFMQKFGNRDTYVSKKTLGVLYRNCKRLEMGLETTNTEVEYKLDPDFIVDDWEKYKNSATKTYQYYCRKVEHLMNIYHFANEGEILAGAILNAPKYDQQRHDMDNLMVLLEFEIQWLFDDLKNIFFKEFGKKPKNNRFTEGMYQKASAWYIVAYEKMEGKVYNYFGLPWAVSDVLISLKQQKCRLKKNKRTNIKSLLEITIDESLKKNSPPEEPEFILSEETEISTIFENRLNVIDAAQTVLDKWLNTQQDHVMIEDLKKFRNLLEIEFMALTEPLLRCQSVQYVKNLKDSNNLKKALSPSYYIIESLLRLACMKIQFHKTSFNNVQQELSLLSWVTLIKLSCTYNPNYLGIPDKDGNIHSNIYFLPRDCVVSTFKLHIFDKGESNEQFSMELLENPSKVIEYLKKVSKMKSIDFRYAIDRDKKFVAIFTVMGSRYATEKLKDLVGQDKFFQWVVKKEKLFSTQS